MSCLFLYNFPEYISSLASGPCGCHHPDNIKSLPILGNWYTDICADSTIRNPSEINARNDCEWFVDKREKADRILLGKMLFSVYDNYFNFLYPGNRVGYRTYHQEEVDIYLSDKIAYNHIVIHTRNGRLMSRRFVDLKILSIDILADHINDMLKDLKHERKESQRKKTRRS